jgi:transposase
MPKRPGDRVKTDSRDAIELARLLRSGDLTPVWVPDSEHEALRNLVRARYVAKADLLRAQHRMVARGSGQRRASRPGAAPIGPGSTRCSCHSP